MNQNLIFLPVLAHVVLSILLYIRLGIEKSKAIKAGNVDRKVAALHNDAWPDNVLKVSNNIRNQFETPILFYVTSILLYLMNAVGFVVLSLAIIYTLSRYTHAYIHTGSNYVQWRLNAFLAGLVILLFLVAIAISVCVASFF